MIEVVDLCKQYGAVPVVENVTFSVASGEILGLLGPNGAGKTTTLRMLAGCMPPTRGSCRICGVDVARNPVSVKAKVGFLPENPPLYLEMTVSEYLAFVAGVRGTPRREIRAVVARIVERCGLGAVRDRMIRNISRGYRQRTGLAQALLHQPAVAILDEPTIGLDPVSILDIRDLIREMGVEGAVILSTHLLHEAEQLCDRLLIMNQGKILADGTPKALFGDSSGPVPCECLLAGEAETIQAILAESALVQDFTLSPAGEGLWLCRFGIPERQKSGELIRQMVEAELRLCGFTLLHPPLEELFRRFVQPTPGVGLPGPASSRERE